METSAVNTRTAVDGAAAALNAAQKELDDRARELDEREAALKKAVDGVDAEKRLMAGQRPSDVIPLNIGGTKTHALRSTLCQYEPSLLAAKFSGRWDDSSPKDADGYFFIDHPYEVFIFLLDFLRAKAIETPDTPVAMPTPAETKCDATLRRIIDYYGLTQFCFPLRAAKHRGVAADISVVAGADLRVDSSSFCTMILQTPPGRHGLHLKSVEVVVDSCESLQIGWIYPQPQDQYGKVDHSTAFPTSDSVSKGVGEEGNTFAFDVARGGICYEGEVKISRPGVSLQAGSVVLCECNTRKGVFKWYADGVLVVEVDLTDPPAFIGTPLTWKSKMYPPSHPQGRSYSFAPPVPQLAISGKGRWHINALSYHQS